MAQERMADQPIDVVLVHGPADTAWAARLDARLRDAGLSTHLTVADLRPGDDITAETDRALARARNGIVVVGDQVPAGAVAEYSAMVRLADAGRLRLIPVLLSAAPMPPLLSRFEPVNLIGADSGADLDRCLPRLLAAIRGTPGRPEGWAPSLLFDRVPEGPVTATLTVGPSGVTLTSPTGATSSGPDDEIVTLLRDPVRAGRRYRDLRPVHRRTADRIVLDGAVGDALADVVRLSRSRGSLLRVAVEIEPGSPLNDVPWEGLCVPGEDTPLALVPNVVLHRSVPGLGETVEPHIPGPLRILAVIASPEEGGGPLLDYEHELATILEQVEAARREKAYVRILNWGSADAIRSALEEERFHVLHVSCHAEPGRLVLERPDGAEDRVDAAGFVRRVLVPGRMVPLVVLAGCSTALAGQDALPSYAQTLLAHGVPAVLAMTAPVEDHYATTLLARTYRRLAREPERPDPLVALSEARRVCEAERRDLPADDPRRDVVEWTVPALFTRVRSLALYRPGEPGPVPRTAGPRIDRQITSLAIGDFVGRRRELRLLLKAMRRPAGAGVVIHGMGGVGKSTLAAAALRELGAEARTVVTMHGRRQPSEILRLIARELRRRTDADGVTLAELADESIPWAERLDLVRDVLDDGQRIALLLDDPLDDPLGGLEPGQTLASAASVPQPGAEFLDFLDRWLDLGPGALAVITLRMAESLRDLPGRSRMTFLHLGELSPAEVQKLLWRLPWVYHLERADRERAYREIGGHPRCLEYLNALLGAGRGDPEPAFGARVSPQRGAFDNVSKRLMRALQARGVERPETIGRQTLDTALGTVLATSAAEVLLDALYHRLDGTPAQRLLTAASVFRTPVDDNGLNWVLAGDPPDDPARTARLRDVYRLLRDTPGGTLETLALEPGRREQLNRDLYGSAYPPRDPALLAARDELLGLSLLSPAGTDDGEGYLVHRWTAGSLATLADPGALATAHAHAAAYHRWHGKVYEADPNLTDLRELHHHAWAAGDPDTAVTAAAELCSRLHARGAYDEELTLCDQTLARLDDDNPQTAFFLHAKAQVAEVRGDHDTATALQERCLALAEASGDGAGLATGRQQLGVIAQLRGDPAAAEESYRAALQICYGLDLDHNPRAEAVLAACYQQLGALALQRGDPDDAARWSIGALELVDRLGDSRVLSRTDDDLARLALAFGDTSLADEHLLGSWELQTTQPDILRLAATAALQLGAVHVLNDRPKAASGELDRAIGLAQRLGDIPLLARCLQLNGDVLFELHRYGEAVEAYRTQLNLLDELDDRTDLIVVYQQLGRVTAARGDKAGAAEYFTSAMALAERAGNRRLVAATHLYRGAAAVDGPEDARRSLTAGLDAATAAGDDTLWISCQLELAALAAAQKQLGDTTQRMTEALLRASATGNESAVVACCLVNGLLARERGEDGDAIDWFLEARGRAAAVGHLRVIADCDLHLGRTAADQRRYDLAEESYRRCLAEADPEQHADLIWSAWRELGRIRADRDDHEAALVALAEALDLVTGTGQPGPELWCLMKLMRSQDRTGDAEGARVTARRCAETVDLLPPSPYTCVGLLCAGDGARDGDDPETARAHYERAMAIARECGRPAAPLAVDGAWRLGELAARAGDHEAAAEHLELAYWLADEIGDRIAAAHALRELGRAVRDCGDRPGARIRLRDAWAAAEGLGDTRMAATAMLLLADLDDADGETERAAGLRAGVAERIPSRATSRPRRAEHHPLYVSVTRGWNDLQWSRRLRTADGETPFVRAQARYLGPSVDHVMREMTPRASYVQGVPAVVAPRVGRSRQAPDVR